MVRSLVSTYRVPRCEHFMPPGTCVVQGCPHEERLEQRLSAPLRVKPRQCSRCRRADPSVPRKSRSAGEYALCARCVEHVAENRRERDENARIRRRWAP